MENFEDNFEFEKEITGIQVYYFFVDKRRLWYFTKGITFEETSELVKLGRIINENSFKKEKKEINLGRIKIDFFRKTFEVHEVKSSSKFKEASKWQIIYYLYVLKKLGIVCKGKIHFVKEKKTEQVILTLALENKLKKILKEIKEVISLPNPPKTHESIKLKNSSYWLFFMA